MPSRWPDILIIDDDELLLGTLTNVLEDQGYSVDIARNGDDGLRMMETAAPRLVICDVRMPGLNGYEVLSQVRHRYEGRAYVSFIFLSGLTDNEFVTAGYEIGADDYLTKPFDNDLLVLKVKAILRHRDHLQLAIADESANREKVEIFQSGLTKAVDGGSAISGSIRLLSLEQLRALFGDEWETLKRKALAITEGIIRRSLAPNDVYTRYGENGFLVLYYGLDEAEAERRTAALADEIRVRLLGEEHPAYRQLPVTATSLDLAKLIDESGRLDLDKLAVLMAEAAPEIAAARTSHKNAGWFTDQLSVQYRPVWNSARQTVMAFQCVPLRTTPYGQLFDRDVLHGGATDPWAIDVDCFVADAIGQYYDVEKPASDIAALCLPLHFTALTDTGRDRLDAILATFCRDLARSRLIIAIIELPEFRGATNVHNAVEWAKSHCRHVAIELAPEDRHVSIARSAGASLLQLRFPAGNVSDSREPLLEKVRSQMEQLKKKRMQGLFEQVDLLDDFAAVAHTGVHMLAGHAIGQLEDFPRQPYELPAAKILA